MSKVKRSPEDIQEQFEDQINFLITSCELFDKGSTAEAKRLALTLRILLNDKGKNSHSLLGQLERLNGSFISTATPCESQNLFSQAGLVGVFISKEKATSYAMLDESITLRWVSFNEWWNEIIFVDSKRETLTRKELILSIADQDGGAHVDPSLEEKYANLSRNHSLEWKVTVESKTYNIEYTERTSTRQIAHELIRTLFPDYPKHKFKPDGEGVLIAATAAVIGDSYKDNLFIEKRKRNDPCPCGSNKKYKICHGFYS